LKRQQRPISTDSDDQSYWKLREQNLIKLIKRLVHLKVFQVHFSSRSPHTTHKTQLTSIWMDVLCVQGEHLS
jgi:hypothetical protein